MKPSIARLALIAAGLACSAVPAAAAPDLVVSGIPSSGAWTGAGGIGGIRAYSFGVQFCNVGAAPASWRANTNQHAVSAHNVYRLLESRFEQIGVSWVAHEFFALQQGNICGECAPGDGSTLGPGCSTPTTSNYTGLQANLGRRSDVNATTVAFPFPFGGGTGDAIFKRVQIAESDLANPASLYFVEALAMHPDDAMADGPGALNNATYRRIAFAPGTYTIAFQGPAAAEAPGVFAWRYHGLGANTPDPSVRVETADVPSGGVVGAGGRFYIAAKATNIGFGRWRYEYAVENLNCDRAASGFTVSMPLSVAPTVANVGFHDINYHSGEVYDPTDWAPIVGATGVEWLSPATFAQDPNTNALRWGTLYNFRFEAEGPPASGHVTLGLFAPAAPGEMASITADSFVPTTPCPGDVNNDRFVNFGDLNLVLAHFGQTGAPGAVQGDANDDGVVNFADLNLALSNFGQGC